MQFSRASLRLVQTRLTVSWITRAPEIWNQPRTVNVESWIKCPKRTERGLSSGEQKLLVGVYEEYKHIITQKRNTVTINKKKSLICLMHTVSSIRD